MAAPVQRFILRTFAGYVDDSTTIEIEDTQASDISNFYLQRGKLVGRKGYTAISTALSPNQHLDGLWWFKINQTPYLLGAHNGNVVNFFNSGLIVTSGTARLSGGYDANGAWLGGKFYFGDGISPNLVFDGTRVSQIVLPQPNACSGTVGASGVLTGNHFYHVTFVSINGSESEPSPVSNTVTPSAQKVNLTQIAIGPSPDTVARRIYRNYNPTVLTLALVTQINDNTTTTYTDNSSDSALGAQLTYATDGSLSDRTLMPPCRYFVDWQNRLVGAYSLHASGDVQTIYISNLLDPTISPEVVDTEDPTQGDRITLQDKGAGTITGLTTWGDKLVIFTAGSMYLLEGTQSIDYIFGRHAEIGCVAHRTIGDTALGLIWLAPDGVYRWDGRQHERISDDQQETIKSIGATGMTQAWAFVWDNKYFLCWPDGSRVYDLRFQQWTKNTAWLWRTGTVSHFTPDAKEKIYANLYNDSKVYQLEDGTTDAGTQITRVWQSKDLDFGLPSEDKRLFKVGAKFKAVSSPITGTVVIQIYRHTGELVQTFTHDLARVRESYEINGKPFADSTLSFFYYEVREECRSTHFRMRVTGTSNDPQPEILQTEFYFQPC